MREYVTIDAKAARDGGLMTIYPQHGGLKELGKRQSIESSRWKLATLVMICVDEWRQRLSTAHSDLSSREDFAKRMDSVWRSVRLISPAALEYLPDLQQSPRRIHRQLESVVQKIDSRKIPDYSNQVSRFHNLRLFFESFLRLGEYTPRSGKRSHKEVQVEVSFDRDKFDPEADVDSVAAKNRLVTHKRSRAELHNAEHYIHGNAPEELIDGPQFFQSVEPLEINRGASLASAARQQIGRNVNRRRAAQLLPGRWEVLNDSEVKKLGARLVKAPENEFASSVALMLVLLTGRELKDVLTFRVVRQRDQLRNKRSVAKAFLVTDSAEWVAGVVRPSERKTVTDKRKSHLQRHHEDVCLPIPQHIWDLISPWVQTRARGAKTASAELFTENDKREIPDQAQAMISSINRGRAARLTLFRIAYHLTEELHRETGDLIEALLISGREPPTGPSAALYYHYVNRQRLVDYYVAVTNRWQQLIFPDAPVVFRQGEFGLDGVVGSDLVIKTNVIRSAIRGLREQCQYDYERLGVQGGLRDLHNSLTNYTLLMLLWLTGYRAVQDPVARVTDFNFHRGTLIITDKTSDGNGHSRLVPLCRPLQEQLRIYLAHTERVRQRLAIIEHRNHPTLFFYLDEDLNELQVRPKSMEEHLWAYTMPLNLNRHWLRGALRQRGVCGSYVNAFMGHWGVGQEPWGKFSSIDPLDYRETVCEALDSIATELGFDVVTESY